MANNALHLKDNYKKLHRMASNVTLSVDLQISCFINCCENIPFLVFENLELSAGASITVLLIVMILMGTIGKTYLLWPSQLRILHPQILLSLCFPGFPSLES
jgi:hypothetical protein